MFEYQVGNVALYHSNIFVAVWIAIIFNSSVADASYLCIWIIGLFYIESRISNQNWVSEC